MFTQQPDTTYFLLSLSLNTYLSTPPCSACPEGSKCKVEEVKFLILIQKYQYTLLLFKLHLISVPETQPRHYDNWKQVGHPGTECQVPPSTDVLLCPL